MQGVIVGYRGGHIGIQRVIVGYRGIMLGEMGEYVRMQEVIL